MTQSFPVPAAAVAFVIGSKGATIQQLQQTCGVTISINRDTSNAEAPFRFASIRGTPRNISLAKQRLVMLIFRFGQLSATDRPSAAPRVHRRMTPERRPTPEPEPKPDSESEAEPEPTPEQPESTEEVTTEEEAEAESDKSEEAEAEEPEEEKKEEAEEPVVVLAPAPPVKRRPMTLAEKKAAAALRK